MAKVRNNLLISGLSGSIGNLVIRQMPDGDTWVSKAPGATSCTEMGFPVCLS
jgi:hypothetical protein